MRTWDASADLAERHNDSDVAVAWARSETVPELPVPTPEGRVGDRAPTRGDRW